MLIEYLFDNDFTIVKLSNHIFALARRIDGKIRRLLRRGGAENVHDVTMKEAPRKPPSERAVRVNITLPPLLARALTRIVHERGYSGPCAYFQEMIRRDAFPETKYPAETRQFHPIEFSKKCGKLLRRTAAKR